VANKSLALTLGANQTTWSMFKFSRIIFFFMGEVLWRIPALKPSLLEVAANTLGQADP